jgi:hypothetical protein
MITLIATAHKNNGLCNSKELVKILEMEKPMVIFEEIPPNKFELIYSGKLHDSLETEAIKKYEENNYILHFPVDLDTTEEEENYLKNTFIGLQNFFSNYSKEHRQISQEHKISVEKFGFSYLNSRKCEELLKRKLFLEKEIVSLLQDIELSKDYNDWLFFIEKRRDTIINNIYSLSRIHKWEMAILLIGAEHRNALIDKIKKFEQENGFGLKWNFQFFEENKRQ